MSIQDPGIFPRIMRSVTPKTAITINNLKDENKFSFADLTLLNNEIQILKKQATEEGDHEMLSQIQSLSQNIIATKSANKQSFTYAVSDKGPYTVFIQSKSSNIGNLDPLSLGKMFFDNDDFNFNIKNIARKGRNRIGVDFANPREANLFVEKNNFVDYDVFIPSYLLTSMGVISDIGLSISEEDIMKYADSTSEIIKVRRLKRRQTIDGKTTYVDAKSCVITFRGKNLPNNIKLFHNIIYVDQYISPVIQCYNCLRYGHTAKQCRGKKRCRNCGSQHEETECEAKKPICIYCSQNHSAVDRICPEFDRQKRIKEAMAVHKYTYFEANIILKNNSRNLYANDKEFPNLTKNNRTDENILRTPATINNQSYAQKVKERQTQTVNNTRRVSTPIQRKRPPPQIPGYNHEEHKKCLIDSQCNDNIPYDWEELKNNSRKENFDIIDNDSNNSQPKKSAQVDYLLPHYFKNSPNSNNRKIQLHQDYKIIQATAIVHQTTDEFKNDEEDDMEINLDN